MNERTHRTRLGRNTTPCGRAKADVVSAVVNHYIRRPMIAQVDSEVQSNKAAYLNGQTGKTTARVFSRCIPNRYGITASVDDEVTTAKSNKPGSVATSNRPICFV
ncbi:hypothetical protein CFRS1_v006578 [Colletotrichum fructicola]|nr:hypothetical protein CFRS1_v006578 [Colletotrichum fructicola]